MTNRFLKLNHNGLMTVRRSSETVLNPWTGACFLMHALRTWTGTITRFIKLCEDTVSLLRQWKFWVTTNHSCLKILFKEVCLNEKTVAFWRPEEDLVKEKDYGFRGFTAKTHFENKIEQRFWTSNAKQAWEGLPVHHGQGKEKAKHEHDMQ